MVTVIENTEKNLNSNCIYKVDILSFIPDPGSQWTQHGHKLESMGTAL